LPSVPGFIRGLVARAEEAALAERQQAERQAAAEDAEDEEFAELPEANLPITDEHFVFRMEDKTYVMEAR
jgi:hypothetical protein